MRLSIQPAMPGQPMVPVNLADREMHDTGERRVERMVCVTAEDACQRGFLMLILLSDGESVTLIHVPGDRE